MGKFLVFQKEFKKKILLKIQIKYPTLDDEEIE